MTEEENQAAAYLKLHEDVKVMVMDIVVEMFKNWNPDIRQQVENMTFGSSLFEQRVKQVITNQMQR